MTAKQLTEIYSPEINVILKKQWFSLFIWEGTEHNAQIKIDGELNAYQLEQLTMILHRIDRLKEPPCLNVPENNNGTLPDIRTA